MAGLVNTLFIGLGGTGIQIGTYLKSMLVHDFGSLSENENYNDNRNIVRFLFIDTDQNWNSPFKGKKYMGIDIGVKDDEKIAISLLSRDKSEIKNQEFYNSLYGNKGNFVSHDFSQGAGAIRVYGRLATKYNFEKINEKISNVKAEVASNREIWNVIVAFSLLGGTGSGVFLDIMFMLQEIMTGTRAKPYFYAATSIGIPTPNVAMKANLVSSLMEMEYIANKELYRDIQLGTYEHFGRNLKKSLADLAIPSTIYLFGNKRINNAGVVTEDIKAEDIFSEVAKHIYYTHIYSATRGVFHSYRNNFQGILNKSPRGLTQIFSTFGVYSEEIPTENIVNFFIKRELIEYLKNTLSERNEEIRMNLDRNFVYNNLVVDDDLSPQYFSNNDDFSPNGKNNIKTIFQNFIEKVNERYGDPNNRNPFLFLSKNQDKILKSDETIKDFYKNCKSLEQENINTIEEKLKQKGEFKKLLSAFKSLKSNIDSDKEVSNNLFVSINNKREEAYKNLKAATKALLEEIESSSKKDAQWLLDRVKKSYDIYFQKTKEYLEIDIKIKLYEKIIKSLDSKINELESLINDYKNQIKTKETELEKLREEIQQKLREFNIDFRNLISTPELVSGFLKEEIAENCNFCNINNKIDNIDSSTLSNICRNKVISKINIVDFIRDNKEVLQTKFNEKSHLMSIVINGAVNRDPKKDDIQYLFVPSNSTQIFVTGFTLDNKALGEKTDRIISIKESSGYPLDVFTVFKDNLEDLLNLSNNLGLQELKNSFTYDFDRFFPIFKEAISTNTRIQPEKIANENETKSKMESQPYIKTEKSEPKEISNDNSTKSVVESKSSTEAILNEYQIEQIGKAMGLIQTENGKDAYFDEEGFDLPTKDEDGFDIPKNIMLKKIEQIILSLLEKDKNSIKEKVKNYIKQEKAKLSEEDYAKLYNQIVEDFIRRY
jgi:hypothetical protein